MFCAIQKKQPIKERPRAAVMNAFLLPASKDSYDLNAFCGREMEMHMERGPEAQVGPFMSEYGQSEFLDNSKSYRNHTTIYLLA